MAQLALILSMDLTGKEWVSLVPKEYLITSDSLLMIIVYYNKVNHDHTYLTKVYLIKILSSIQTHSTFVELLRIYTANLNV